MEFIGATFLVCILLCFYHHLCVFIFCDMSTALLYNGDVRRNFPASEFFACISFLFFVIILSPELYRRVISSWEMHFSLRWSIEPLIISHFNLFHMYNLWGYYWHPVNSRLSYPVPAKFPATLPGSEIPSRAIPVAYLLLR